MDPRELQNPFKMARLLWPNVTFYDQQRAIIQSVVDNSKTLVPAGNMLGKDFVTAFIVLWFFLSRVPCRIVTTSVDHSQLSSVLWGELRRFIQTSAYPLDASKGGPLLVNHLHLRRVYRGNVDGLSYCIGRVAEKGEGMLGHHIAAQADGVPRTLYVADEASGIEDVSYERADTWARRMLIIGNPYPCTNFFFKGVKAGVKLPYRNVIRIRAEDSPNVKYGLAERKLGRQQSNRLLVDGVLPYADYVERRATWDPIRQCIGLDADFYEGAEVMMFPTEWLNHSERRAEELVGQKRQAKAVGIDTGEGSANTSMAAVDEYGLIEQVSRRTPDTNIIIGEVCAFGQKHGVNPINWMFDRGGGGKEHADRLRAMGKPVRTVPFGGGVSLPPKHGRYQVNTRRENVEERYAYFNKRSEMYGELRLRCDPSIGKGFAIPAKYAELRRQLAAIPLERDDEGRLKLRSKGGEDGLMAILGCSPDEADALVLAVYGMSNAAKPQVAGVAF